MAPVTGSSFNCPADAAAAAAAKVYRAVCRANVATGDMTTPFRRKL
jgi:hypothetical protein